MCNKAARKLESDLHGAGRRLWSVPKSVTGPKPGRQNLPLVVVAAKIRVNFRLHARARPKAVRFRGFSYLIEMSLLFALVL